MNEYVIRNMSTMDIVAGLRQSSRTAYEEQMPVTGERCIRYADNLLNAQAAMVELCPEGYTVEMEIVFKIVPRVNAYARSA